MNKKLLHVFFVATNNLQMVEIGLQNKGNMSSPVKKALYLIVRTKRDFQIICKEFVTEITKDISNPGCMCNLSPLQSISKLTGFSITKHTEDYIRDRYKNSKCKSIDGENIMRFLRESRV
jgi:hypothetical protein